MLLNINDLRGYTMRATDGEIGTIEDFYFDDLYWTIRYLVVATGNWLFGRRVLISPVFVGHPDADGHIPVSLTREEVKNSPDVDTRRPVSRQHDLEMAPYLGWPPYGLVGGAMFPPPAIAELPVAMRGPKQDPNLRSTNAVRGYHVAATDGDVGKLSDFIADEASWHIRFISVDTGNWLNRNLVLVAPGWIKDISWEDRTVRVDLNAEAIQRSPEFDPAHPISADYAFQLHAHYGKTVSHDTADAPQVRLSRMETKALYDKISGVYDLLSERSERRVREAALDRLAGQTGETILEIGFGTGHCLPDVARNVGPAGKVYGIDLSDGMLAEAEALIVREGVSDRVNLRRGDAIALPYGDGIMDGVFMSFTLELFDAQEIAIVLGECKRVLKPQGRIVVAGMSKQGEHGLIYEAYRWTHRHFPNFVDCRPISVRRAVESAGFTVTATDLMRIWVPVEVVLGVK